MKQYRHKAFLHYLHSRAFRMDRIYRIHTFLGVQWHRMNFAFVAALFFGSLSAHLSIFNLTSSMPLFFLLSDMAYIIFCCGRARLINDTLYLSYRTFSPAEILRSQKHMFYNYSMNSLSGKVSVYKRLISTNVFSDNSCVSSICDPVFTPILLPGKNLFARLIIKNHLPRKKHRTPALRRYAVFFFFLIRIIPDHRM